MRTDNSAFASENLSQWREPRYVFAVDFGGGDIVYLTSHAIDGLSGENVVEGVISAASGTSQKLDPLKANAEIGNIDFTVLDDGLTDLQREKLAEGKGLRKKVVQSFIGWESIAWNEYILTATQLVEEVSYSDNAYRFRCADIQRELRKDIFVQAETRLAATLRPEDDVIEVFSTDGFEMYQHPVVDDAEFSGQKIGLLLIEEEDYVEIASYTGKSGSSFTGVTRGLLNTSPIEIEISGDTDRDNAPKITEFVYLEMPAPMLAYALLTGYILGYPGEMLPESWHMGVTANFIRTSEYEGIGPDLWDQENPGRGRVLRFAGEEKVDGKQFVEEQIFRAMGCYAPIYSDGQLGLRRQTRILSQAGYDRLLNEDNVVSAGDLKHDMKALANVIVVDWNYDWRAKETTRSHRLIDAASIQKHNTSDPLEIELRGIFGSRHTTETIKTIMDEQRDQYAGPPLVTSLTLTPDQNDLEIGDIVRVQLEIIQDYSGSVGPIDRNFEVRQIKTDWITGAVRVDLFGSSEAPGYIPPIEAGSAIPDDAYEVRGTEISPANFPGAVTISDGITRITADIDLSGADSIGNDAAVYWCGTPLTVNNGVTVTINQNVAMLVRGFFQVNGVIDGVGRGHSPGVGCSVFGGAGRTLWSPENIGVPGYIDCALTPQGGLLTDASIGPIRFIAQPLDLPNDLEVAITRGVLPAGHAIPAIDIDLSNGVFADIDLRGGSGSGGGILRSPGGEAVLPGGAGGAGGAGLFIVCRGMAFSPSGRIDISGEDASLPPEPSVGFGERWPGSGAPGGPGACYVVVDGAQEIAPDITSATAIANTGQITWGGSRITGRYEWGVAGSENVSVSSGFGPAPAVSSLGPGAFRVQWVAGGIDPVPDEPDETDNPLSVVLTELTNTPRSANANLSTIEVGIIRPPASNYVYALVEYRPKGERGWFEVGPASPEVGFVVPSDGTTYEVRARGVSRSGVVNPTAEIYEITTTRILQPGDEPEDDDEPEVVARVPDVSGLELFEQGHDTVFGGRDAKFAWRKTSVTEWFELGSEGQQGAGAGALDLYFKDYQVEIWAGTQLLRTEWVVDPEFIYSFEKNAEDFLRIHGVLGAWRQFECRVYCRGRQNQLSENPARLIVENPAPGLPDQLEITPSLRSIEIRFKAPDDLDYRHTRVWLSDQSGFVPSDETLAAQVDGSVAIQGLIDGTTYYIRLASYDTFGRGVMSPELPVTTQTLQVDDVEGLPEDLAGIGGDLTAIQEDLNGAMDELADQAQELADAGNAIINLQNDYQSLDGTVSGHTLAILAADARIEDTEDGLVAQGQQITLIEAGLQTVTDDVVAAQDAADQAALDAAAAAGIAESKGKVIIQSGEPAIADRLPQNLWIDTAGGANTPKRWSGSAWQPVTDQVAVDAAAAAAQAQTDAAAAAGIAEGKGKVIIQSAEPAIADRLPQNLWIDTTAGANTPKRWTGSQWQAVTDQVAQSAATAAAQAQADAAAAAGIAEGKGKVIIQAQVPDEADELPQNLWIDTTDGANTPKRWSGSAWEPVTDQAAIDAADAAAQAQADATQALIEASAHAGLIDGLTVRVADTEDGLAAEAARLSGVESRVGENEAGVTQLMSSVGGLEAQYVLAVKQGGVVTGMKIAAGEDISRIVFEADEFIILPTGGDPDDDAIAPFYFDGEWIRIDKLRVGSINYDDNSIDLATKVTGQIAGDNIQDGAILNLTGKAEAPGTVIFTGDDDDQWIDVVSMPVQVLGAGSALAVQYHFGFTIDQVSKTYAQAGPGGPICEMRVVRDDVAVWTPDPLMVSGSGRVALQFTSRIDTGATPGLHTYKIQIKWKKGFYDAGTVDYTVNWNNDGEASLNFFYNRGSGEGGLVFNGCQPTTYLGEGWELTFPGTGADPFPLVGVPSVRTGVTLLPETTGWVDWRTYHGTGIRAPSLDRPPEPASSQRFTDQPYEAVNNSHYLKGTLSDLWILAFEYRG